MYVHTLQEELAQARNDHSGSMEQVGQRAAEAAEHAKIRHALEGQVRVRSTHSTAELAQHEMRILHWTHLNLSDI